MTIMSPRLAAGPMDVIARSFPMQTIASQLSEIFRDAIRQALGFDADPLIGASQDEKFGDYQSNAAMGLAKLVYRKPATRSTPAPSPNRSSPVSPSRPRWPTWRRKSPLPGRVSLTCG